MAKRKEQPTATPGNCVGQGGGPPSEPKGFVPTGEDLWGRGGRMVGPMGLPNEGPNSWAGDGGASFEDEERQAARRRSIPRGNGSGGYRK